jgi:hypothetical protein
MRAQIGIRARVVAGHCVVGVFHGREKVSAHIVAGRADAIAPFARYIRGGPLIPPVSDSLPLSARRPSAACWRPEQSPAPRAARGRTSAHWKLR